MTANATLDITSIMPQAATDNVVKLHSDTPAGAFDGVFENVNKAYENQENNTAKVSQNTSSQNVQEKPVDNSADNSVSYKNTSDDKKNVSNSETKTPKEQAPQEVKQKSDEAEAQGSVAQTKADELNQLAQKIAELQAALSAKIETEPQLAEQLQKLQAAFDELKTQVLTNNSQTQSVNSENTIQDELLVQVETMLSALQQSALSVQTPQTVENANATEVLETAVDVNVAQYSNAVKTPVNNGANQAQQPTQQQQTVQQSVQNQQTPAGVNVQTPELPEEALVETPVIKASVEVASSDVNVTELSKDNLKDAMSKTSLSQEVIDGTDAKVVKVQATSDSSSNQNFMNNQNPQEQAVKLELQGLNQNSAIVADDIQTSGFDKVMTSTQTQMPSAPRQLSQTEIMSQIHTKLADFKSDETSKVTIILRPENLGKINLELITSKEGLSAMLTAENAQVKEILDKNLDGLKDSLGNQGVNVNNVTVKVAEAQKQDNTFSFDAQQEQNNKQAQDNNPTKGEFSTVDEDEIAGADDVITNEAEQNIENSVSIKSHLGQVDYKV